MSLNDENSMIGIVCFWDRLATPYLKKYEDVLVEQGVDYEVLFWNRNSDIVEDKDRYVYVNQNCAGSKLKKIGIFIKWRKQVLKILSQRQYDKLIILSTIPGVLLYNYLRRYYKGRFLFDIRDYTLEANPIFSHIVTRLVDFSAFTTISSKGYYEWLRPSNKIIPNHNITCGNVELVDKEYFAREKLNFTFVGNVRLDLQTRMVLSQLKNSKRYKSGFIGRIVPGCDILQLCKEDKIDNVFFRGAFDVAEKPIIYENIDLINAVYANAPAGKINYGDSTPLPNRIYDCVCFKVPIVCCKGIYLEKIVKQYKLGFAIDAFTDNVEEEFNSYIKSFDKDTFLSGCELFLDEVRKEEQVFLNYLKEFLI